jgi:hypothetical protein
MSHYENCTELAREMIDWLETLHQAINVSPSLYACNMWCPSGQEPAFENNFQAKCSELRQIHVRYEMFALVNTDTVIFWVVTSYEYSLVGGHQGLSEML